MKWLLEHLTPEMYDLLEIPVRWEPGEASRSHLRIPRRDIFYHDGPLLKREPHMIAKMLAAPPMPRKILGAAAAHKIAGVIVDASAVRYRELYGFLYPDLKRIEHAEPGRGIDVFLFAPSRRLPVRDYLCGMFFKNGVPIGYIEGLIREGNMEAGFNLYYTFRDGETAWLYAVLLKLLQERSGVKTFSVDPYQIGHENEEAHRLRGLLVLPKTRFRAGIEGAVAAFVEGRAEDRGATGLSDGGGYTKKTGLFTASVRRIVITSKILWPIPNPPPTTSRTR